MIRSLMDTILLYCIAITTYIRMDIALQSAWKIGPIQFTKSHMLYLFHLGLN
jgi:hypothetical protein